MSAIQPNLPLQRHRAPALMTPIGPAPLPPRRSAPGQMRRAGSAGRLATWSPATARPLRGAMRDLTVGLTVALLVVEAILACTGV